MFIVESLLTHKRMPVYLQNKITSLDKITVCTKFYEVSLSSILSKISKKEDGHRIGSKILDADNEGLNNYFSMIISDYDKGLVCPSHIKKILSWYNLLVKEKLMDFVEENEEDKTDCETM